MAVGAFSGAKSVFNGGFSATIGTHSIHQQPRTFDPEPDTISCPTTGFCLAAGDESIERFDRFNGSFFGG